MSSNSCRKKSRGLFKPLIIRRSIFDSAARGAWARERVELRVRRQTRNGGRRRRTGSQPISAQKLLVVNDLSSSRPERGKKKPSQSELSLRCCLDYGFSSLSLRSPSAGGARWLRGERSTWLRKELGQGGLEETIGHPRARLARSLGSWAALYRRQRQQL